MKLSLTSWSLPACTLTEAVGISRALGINALDLGLFYRAGLDKNALLSDPQKLAKMVRGLGLDIPNYYHLFGSSLSDRNLADPKNLAQNLLDLEAVLTFAKAAHIPSIFILPGVVNAGQSRAQAMQASIQSLIPMMEMARKHDVTLCIEPHVHSLAESPKIALEIVKETGVKLALDYSHFACLGYRQDEIDVLAPFAGHVHLRQAKMGALQSKFHQGTLNFPAMFGALRDAGYQGALAIEPVHQDYMNTLYDDVLTEIIALRDCYLEWKG